MCGNLTVVGVSLVN